MKGEQKMKLAKSITDILESRDINIISTEKQQNEYITELEFWSDAGEDFIITLWHDRTKKSFVDAFISYFLDFDPGEHAEMWVEYRGTRGVPESIRTLIDDADSIKAFLEETATALRTA